MSLFGNRRERRELRIALLDNLQSQQTFEDDELVGTPKSAVGESLVGVSLQGADLRWADLRECNLRNADLTGARLDHADLSWSSLEDAILQDVDFGQARLVETVMNGAAVNGADLRYVTGLTYATVHNIRGANDAQWPEGFDRQAPRVGGPVLHHPWSPQN